MTNEDCNIDIVKISTKNNIIVAVFFNCVMGVDTIDKNNFPEQQKEEFMLKIFNGMGFNSAQEYLGLYPGEYLFSSQECGAACLSCSNTRSPLAGLVGPIKNNTNISNVEIFKFINVFKELNILIIKKVVLNNVLSGNYEFIPIVQPTSQKLIEAGSVESDMSDFLCICSDWKEP